MFQPFLRFYRIIRVSVLKCTARKFQPFLRFYSV